MADLSKVKVLGTVYNLKDAQGRADLASLIASLGDAAYEDILTNIEAGEGKLIDAATIKAYVDAQVGAIHKFDVVVADELPTAAEGTMYKLYLIPKAGTETGNAKEEWITIRSGVEGSYTYAWEKIGDTEIDLSGYVQKTQKVAGIDLQDDITVAELQGALELGGLAYLDEGSVTVEIADDLTMDSYTPAGNVTLNAFTQTSTAATLTKGDFTPAGSVSGDAISGADVAVTLADAATATEAALTRDDYTPAGTVSKPSITVTPSDDTIQPVTSVGTMASVDVSKFNGGSVATFNEGAFTPASLTKGTAISAATEGVVASIGTGDDAETLILTAAATDDVLDYNCEFDGGSKVADTFDGGSVASLADGFFTAGQAPTLGTAKTFLTGASAALDANPVFEGTKETGLKVTKAEYNKQVVQSAALENLVAANETFVGTKAENVLVTGVNYDKATANGASFTGTAEVLTGTINKSEKTIDVDFE